MKDEALRLALEALESGEKMQNGRLVWIEHDISLVKQAIPAIKAALEEKDEPDHSDELTIAYMSGLHRGKEVAQRTWVELTNQELSDCWDTIPERAMKQVEAKLKEKNT